MTYRRAPAPATVPRGRGQGIQLRTDEAYRGVSAGSEAARTSRAAATHEPRAQLEGLNERSGVDWRHIHKIEAGTLNVTLVTLHRLAKGLGVAIPDLFESDRKPG